MISIGYVAKNWFISDDTFWKNSDKLVYYVFFPSLLVLDISSANFAGDNTSTALMATFGSTVIIAALIFIVQRIAQAKNDLFTSIFQGGVRYNSYVFIALVLGMII